MATQRRPSHDPHRRPPTGRHPTSPTRRFEAPARKKSSLPLVLGAAAGGVLLLVLVIAATSGGGKRTQVVAKPTAPKVEPPKKPPVPDVSHLEAEGRTKCEEGMRRVKPRLSPDSSTPKAVARADLEAGLKLLKDGLAAFEKAASIAGKTYPVDEFRQARTRGIKVLCTDLEKEAQDFCDQGLRIIQSTETQMVDGAKLSDEDKKKLKAELEKGVKLITDGMNLFDRSYQVSEHLFDTNKYGQALKMTRSKLLELK
jgi:hypothetical protein